MIAENEGPIRKALRLVNFVRIVANFFVFSADLNKSKNEALLHELNVVKGEVFETIKEVAVTGEPLFISH